MKTTLRLAWIYFTDAYTIFVMLVTTLGIAPALVLIGYYLCTNQIEKAVAMAIIFYILINTNLKLGGITVEQRH